MPGNEHAAHGLQLWVNLPKKYKLIEPDYQELLKKDIPKVTRKINNNNNNDNTNNVSDEEDDVTATVIVGKALDTESKVTTKTPIHYIYYELKPNAYVYGIVLLCN